MLKSVTAAAKIRNNITSGKYADGKLPGERILASTLNLGRCTIRTALQLLEDEGLIEKRYKSGTFIKPKSAPKYKGTAGLIARDKGHFYKDIHDEIYSALSNAGYSVQSIPTAYLTFTKKAQALKQRMEIQIRELLKSSPSVIIISGYCYGQIPLKKELEKYNPIIFDYYDFRQKDIPAGVWFDFESIGYMAGKYLVENGCRKPLFVSHYIPISVRLDNDFYQHHREKLLIDGFKKALREAKIDTECCIFDSFAANLKNYHSAIEAFCLSKCYVPDGICGSSDSIAAQFLQIYRENSIKLPKNFICMGIGNTPWSNNPTLKPFTTIDLNLSEAAQAIMKEAKKTPEKRKNVYIKPILIENNQK